VIYGILRAVRPVVVLLLATVGAGAVAAPTTAVSTRPALRVAEPSPLMISGTGFRASEHVRVVAIAGKRATHWVTAGARGRFAVRFRGMYADTCRGLTAIAIGDLGSRATYKRAPGECPNS
jgi:hypothetical protein